MEWDNVLPHNINFYDSADKLPEKLQIPKFNRHDRDILHVKVVNYTERIAAKLHSIEKLVKADYRQKNNLKKSEQKAVEELRIAVKNKQIVICKSDKDGKIALVNYHDYNVIIEKELSKFSHLHTLTNNNIKSYLNKIRKTAEDKIIELHQHGAISDDLLKHTVGIKLYDHTKYKRISGTLAKYFICDKPGYAYPLFKTHKLDAD